MADSGARDAGVRADLKTRTILFVAALLVRLLYTLARDIGDPIPYGTDSVSYDAFARAMGAGTGWILNPGPELFRPPGYPAVLAVLYALTGGNLALVQLLQSLVGAASVVLLYDLGMRHAGRTAALAAACWLLVNPLHLDFNGKILRESWLVLLNIALIASILARDTFRLPGLARTALLFTILMHFDSRYIFHLPFFLLYYALLRPRPPGRPLSALPGALRPAALFVLFTLLFSAPWAVRNALAYDHLVLIDPRALAKWGGRAQAAVAGDAQSPRDLLLEFEAKKTARLDSLRSEERRAFLAGMRPRTGQPHKAIFNFVEFWRLAHFGYEYRPLPDGRFAGPWSRSHNVGSLLFMGLLLPPFLLGSFRLLRDGEKWGLVLLAFIAVHTLLHVLVHSVTRYRLPIEPFFALIAFREVVRWPFLRLAGRSRAA